MSQALIPHLKLRFFEGPQPYVPIFEAMRAFTLTRDITTADELWILEHEPTYTQGQAGEDRHVLAPPLYPVVSSDRGGQITYHGPGQLICYTLIDLKRRDYSIHDLVNHLEQGIIGYLHALHIKANANPKARGVYVQGQKIASIGMRSRKQCCYHGFSFNVDMDLSPFNAINPCGHKGLEMTQLQAFSNQNMTQVKHDILSHILPALGPYKSVNMDSSKT